VGGREHIDEPSWEEEEGEREWCPQWLLQLGVAVSHLTGTAYQHKNNLQAEEEEEGMEVTA
jgi:hypothetical protein